jgi:hypothetical protein
MQRDIKPLRLQKEHTLREDILKQQHSFLMRKVDIVKPKRKQRMLKVVILKPEEVPPTPKGIIVRQ